MSPQSSRFTRISWADTSAMRTQPVTAIKLQLTRISEITDAELVERLFRLEPFDDARHLASEKIDGDEAASHRIDPTEALAVQTASMLDPVLRHGSIIVSVRVADVARSPPAEG